MQLYKDIGMFRTCNPHQRIDEFLMKVSGILQKQQGDPPITCLQDRTVWVKNCFFLWQ